MLIERAQLPVCDGQAPTLHFIDAARNHRETRAAITSGLTMDSSGCSMTV